MKINEAAFEQVVILMKKIAGGIDEVKARSINNIYTKIRAKIITTEQIITKCIQLPGVLLQWINEHQRTGSPMTIKKAFIILLEIAKQRKGVEILNSFGFLEFGMAYVKNLKDKKLDRQGQYKEIRDVVEGIIAVIVDFNGVREQKSVLLTGTINKENIDNQPPAHEQNQDFIKTKKPNQHQQQLQVLTQTRQKITKPRQNIRKIMKSAKYPLAMKTLDEMLILPIVTLSEQDEKCLFDIGVKLKFANPSQISHIMINTVPQLIEDFPVDIFLQRSEILEGIISRIQSHNGTFTQISLILLQKILQKLFYRLKQHQVRTLDRSTNLKISARHLLNNDKLYIKQSYPEVYENLQAVEMAKHCANLKCTSANRIIEQLVPQLLALFGKDKYLSRVFEIMQVCLSIMELYRRENKEAGEVVILEICKVMMKEIIAIKHQQGDMFIKKLENIALLKHFISWFRLVDPTLYEDSIEQFSALLEIFQSCVCLFRFSQSEIADIQTFSRVLSTESFNRSKQIDGMLDAYQTRQNLLHLVANSQAFDETDVVEITAVLKRYMLVLPEYYEEVFFGLLIRALTKNLQELEIMKALGGGYANQEAYERSLSLLKEMALQLLSGSQKLGTGLLEAMKKTPQRDLEFIVNYMNDNEEYLQQLILLSAMKEGTKSLFASFLLQLWTENQLKGLPIHLHYIHALAATNEHYRILLQAIIKDNPLLTLKNKLMNLFSKNPSQRCENYSGMLPIKRENFDKELIVDPLKSYLSLEGNQLREFSWFKPFVTNVVKGTAIVSLNDLENLLSIAINPMIDASLRQSSFDQLVESLCMCKLEDQSIKEEFVPKVVRLMKKELTGQLDKLDITNSFFKSVLRGFIKLIELFHTETRLTFTNLINQSESELLFSLKDHLTASENTLELKFYILSLIQHILFTGPFSRDIQENYFILQVKAPENQEEILVESLTQQWKIYPLSPEEKNYINQLIGSQYEVLSKQALKELCDDIFERKITKNNQVGFKNSMESLNWLNDIWACGNFILHKEEICEDIVKTSLKSFIGGLNFHLSQDSIKLFMETIELTIRSITKLDSPELLISIIEFIRLNLMPIIIETPDENLKDKVQLLTLMIKTVSLLLQIATGQAIPLLQRILIKQKFPEQVLRILRNVPNHPELVLTATEFAFNIVQWKIPLKTLVTEGILFYIIVGEGEDTFYGKKRIRTFLELLLKIINQNTRMKKQKVNVLNESLLNVDNMLQSGLIGWLYRLLNDREIHIRMLVWSIFSEIYSPVLLKTHRSLIDLALESVTLLNEAYAVKSLCLYFIQKVMIMLQGYQLNIDDDVDVVRQIVKKIMSKGLISNSKGFISNPEVPNLYKMNFLMVIRGLLTLESKQVLSTLIQYELLEDIINLLDPSTILPSFKSSQKQQVSKLLTNIICQTVIHCVTYEIQLVDYVISSTKLISFLIQLFAEKQSHSEGFCISAFQLLAILISKSPRIGVFEINRICEQNFEKLNPMKSVFEIIQKYQKTQRVQIAALQFLQVITLHWQKAQIALDDIENPMGEEIIQKMFVTYSALRSDRKTRLVMFRGVSTLLMSSFSAKVGFIQTGWLQDLLEHCQELIDGLVKLQIRKNRQKQVLLKEEMQDVLRVISCFFGRMNKQHDASSNLPQEKLITSYLQKSTKTLGSLFKALWTYSIKDPNLLQYFLNILTNWGNNKNLQGNFFTVCSGIYGKIFQEISKQNFSPSDSLLKVILTGFLQKNLNIKEVRVKSYQKKFIHEVSLQLKRCWGNKRQWLATNPILLQIIDIFLSFSFHEDSHKKILVNHLNWITFQTTNFLLNGYMDLLKQMSYRGVHTSRILLTMCNLAHSFSNKANFTQNKDIIPLFMMILNQSQQLLRNRLIASQFFLNLTYKYVNGLKVLKKKQVLDQIRFLAEDLQTEVDRMTLLNREKNTDDEDVGMTKELLDNVNQLLTILHEV